MTKAEIFSQGDGDEFEKEIFEFGDRLLYFDDDSMILEPYGSKETLVFNSSMEYNSYLDCLFLEA